MPVANLTPLTSIVSATGWTGATIANLNASDNARATGGTLGEVILAELTDSPADYDTPNTITFGVEWLLSATATRPKSVLVELVSADGLTVYASWPTPDKTTTAEVVNSSGPIAFTIAPTKTQLDAARLRLTAQEGGGMADTAAISIDHVTVALDYNAAAPPPIVLEAALTATGTVAADLTAPGPLPAAFAAALIGSGTVAATLATNAPPATPSIVSADVTDNDVLVTASAFSDPDAGDTSGGRRWRVYQA